MSLEPSVSELAARLLSLASQDGLALRDHTRGSTPQTLSWLQLDRLARRHAARLASLGVVAGDRVVVQAEPSAEHVAALLAHLRLGVVHVPLSPRASEAEARHVIEDSGASQVLRTWPPANPDETNLDEPSPEDSLLPTFSELPSSDTLALLIYTSGTTGRPKGVMQTHASVMANVLAVMKHWQVDRGDRVIAMLPLFHVHGLCLTVLGPLLTGATVELFARFDVNRLRSAMTAGATVFMGVPTMYHVLLDHLAGHPDDAAAFASARLFTAGSAALAPADFARFEAATGHRILERYGMTETLFALSNPYDGERRPGTVGLPVPGVEVQLVDEGGADAGDGPGEIEIRGAGVMAGYWGNTLATTAAFRGGWFRTGDTAVIVDGYWRIVGRTSTDIIKSGGHKIGAREIEDVLLATGHFVEVAVLGTPDPRWGEVVAAVVVPRAGVTVASDADEASWLAVLRSSLEANLIDYKRPRRLAVIAKLPRNGMGKVQKLPLRDLFEKKTDAVA